MKNVVASGGPQSTPIKAQRTYNQMIVFWKLEGLEMLGRGEDVEEGIEDKMAGCREPV